MKKIFYLASIAALAFSSCTKDDTTGAVIDTVGGGSKIMAKAEGDATRTHLELNEDGNYEFRWSENDVIGVYGSDATSAKNVPFALLDSYADQAEGVFESDYKLLAGDNFFAYYPQVPGNDYAPVWVKASGSGATAVAAYWNLKPFKMKISKDQNYKPGSFNTVTAPAVSTAFTIDEDGNADVTMQPVADYLFVNLAGVEDIQTVTLELWSAKYEGDKVSKVGVWNYLGTDKRIIDWYKNVASFYNNQPSNTPFNHASYFFPFSTNPLEWEYVIVETATPQYSNYAPVNIAGDGTLVPYTYIDAEKNKSTRYYLSNEGMTTNKITLAAGQLTDVVCHDPNTYVFVVPGGLLGMNPLATGDSNKELVAKVTVDNGDGAQQVFEFGGKSINGGYAVKANGADDTTKPMWRGKDANGNYTWKLENTVFWANPNIKNVRQTALFNPNNDFIIYNEVDFLQYMNEYNDDTELKKEIAAIEASTMTSEAKRAAIKAARNASPYGHGAYVCTQHEFDFSDDNMRSIAAQIVKTDNSANTEALRRYIDDYVAKGVPCVADYTSKFKGNGATFHALKKLQSENGLFGNIGRGAVIKEITFEGIVAPEYTTDEQATDANGKPIFDSTTGNKVMATAQGVVLGNADPLAKFDKVGVTGADARAILENGNVAQYEGLVLEDVDALDMIFDYLNMEKDLTFKNWDVASTVGEDVFGVVTATEATNPTTKATDAHHVVTIATGDADEYDMLAGYVKVYRGTNKAVSVVINNVSYWTGSTVNTSALPSATAAVNPIAYAEQLAYGKSEKMGAYKGKTYAALTRNMDANYENIGISWPNEVDYSAVEFDGGEFAVKGIVLNYIIAPNEAQKATWGVMYNAQKIEDLYTEAVTIDEDKKTTMTLAPFKFTNVADLTLDGVEINMETDNVKGYVVPAKVAGMSIDAEDVSNVAIKGLNIDTFEVSKSLNHDAYYGDVVPVIGWLVADATNIQVEDSSADVVYSALEGRAGLVGQVTIGDYDSFFDGCTVTYGDLKDQDAIDDFISFEAKKYKNVYGTMVGLVINNETKAHGIKFYNSGKPVFLYDNKDDDGKVINAINVYYDNETIVLDK